MTTMNELTFSADEVAAAAQRISPAAQLELNVQLLLGRVEKMSKENESLTKQVLDLEASLALEPETPGV